MNSQQIVRKAMSILGSRKSAAKTKACRANAKKKRRSKIALANGLHKVQSNPSRKKIEKCQT